MLAHGLLVFRVVNKRFIKQMSKISSKSGSLKRLIGAINLMADKISYNKLCRIASVISEFRYDTRGKGVDDKRLTLIFLLIIHIPTLYKWIGYAAKSNCDWRNRIGRAASC